MRKYSKFVVVGGAIAALAVPSAAMADPGNGSGNAYGNAAPTNGYVFKDGAPATTGAVNSGNPIAVGSSQIVQNGPAVVQQTQQPGGRSAQVQQALAEDGLGSLAS